MEPHWAVRPSKRRMTFPDVLCLRKCCVKVLLNNSMLTCHDFLFMFTSDLGFKPSCLLMTPCILKLDAESDLHHYNPTITLTFSVFCSDVKTWTLSETFSIITQSGLLCMCLPISSVLKMFPCLSQKVIFSSFFLSGLKKRCNSCLGHSLFSRQRQNFTLLTLNLHSSPNPP